MRAREFAGSEGVAYTGKVVGYDSARATVRVQYGAGDHENLPLASFDVAWVSKPFILRSAVPRPTTAALAKGYMVDTRCDNVDAEDDDVFVGCVVDVDKVHNTVTVQYEAVDGPGDREIHAFESQDLAWMQRPTHPIFHFSKVRRCTPCLPARAHLCVVAEPRITPQKPRPTPHTPPHHAPHTPPHHAPHTLHALRACRCHARPWPTPWATLWT